MFIKLAVPLLKRLVAGLSLLWPGFSPRADSVEFVVDKVVTGQVLSTHLSLCHKL